CGAVVTGEGVFGFEAADVGHFAEDLGGGQGADPGDAQQGGCQIFDPGGDLGFEVVGGEAPRSDPLDQVGGGLGGRCPDGPQPGPDGCEVGGAAQRASWRVPVRVELMEMPAEPVDVPGAFFDQVLTVIDQQPQVTAGAIEVRHGQVWFPQGGASH